MIYVIKNPNATTRAFVSETPTGRDGEEAMTEADYKAWIDAQPAIEDVQCPTSIEQYKLRLWLIEKGMLPLVESMIANAANWPSAQAHAEAVTRWDYVQNVQRDSVMVNTLGAALGLDQHEIDVAFIEAEKLT